MTLFDIASLEKELHSLEKKTEEPSFWEDSQNSSKILKRINELKNKTENYKKISSTFEYTEELNELVKSCPFSYVKIYLLLSSSLGVIEFFNSV